jgi:pyruvate,water dikinase
MKESSSKPKKSIYFWEDYQYKNLRESSVGRKGLSLFALKDMDIPIPEFFVVSPVVFDEIVSATFFRDSAKLLEKGHNPENEEVAKSISKTEFSRDIEEDILSAYTRISGFTDSWVSVRSSVVFPQNEEVSFSGIFSTELNVRGFKNILDSIKNIYSSMFTDDVVAYATHKGINLADVKLAVVVQRMVQAEVSGVAFTVDPITQDPTKLSIEAVFGLGDAIALGELTPDTYLLNKKDLSVIEKHISPQDWMKVRTIGKGKSGVEKIKISSNWSHMQKLEDKYLKEISKIALIVENRGRQPQVLEWVLAGGRIWVLQSKDLYERNSEDIVQIVTDVSEFDTLAEIIKWLADRYAGIGLIESKALEHAKRIVNGNKHDYDTMTEKLVKIAKNKTTESSVPTPVKNINKGSLVLSGIGASFGTVLGRVVVLEEDVKIDLNKNDILVIKKFASEMESHIVKVGGVIMDTGGLTSDTAILCREFDIPAVVGADNASSILKSGDIVRIDGNSGTVYIEKDPAIIKALSKKEIKKETHPVVEAYKEEKLSSVDQKEDTVKELNIKHDNTLPPCATKVFIFPDKNEKLEEYVGDSHGIVYVDLDEIMLSVGKYLIAYVQEKRFVQYSKLVSDKVCEIVDLAQGNQVVLSIGSSTVGKFRELTKAKLYENKDLEASVHGLTRYLNNEEYLTRVLKIVRRIRNVYKKRNVDIAVHSPINGKLMKEFKRNLSAGGLRRTTTFRVYAILDNPSEVIMAEDIMDAKIDGLILNMPRIVRVMQGFDMDNTKAKYDLGVNSAFKIVDSVNKDTKRTNPQIIVIAENNKALISYSVSQGVYGISVTPKDVKEVRKLVSSEEAKLILSSK